MREDQLPSPGIGTRGFHLRRVAAAGLSDLQRGAASAGAAAHPSAVTLAAFFTACAAAATELSKTLPAATLVLNDVSEPESGGTTPTLTLNKGGSAGAATYSSSNTAVATVHATTGVITRVGDGTVQFTAAIAGTATYRAATAVSQVLTLTAV